MRIFIFLCGLLMFASSANATIIYSASGLSGTFDTEDFDTNAGHGTAAGSQFSGMTFSAGNYVSNSFNGTYPNMTNSVIDNFGAGCCNDPTSFLFDSRLSELAFAFVSNTQATVFSAYLGNALVESMSLNTNYSGNYVNFTGFLFDEIRITSTGSNDAYILDDMQIKIAAIPEPSSIALFGLGLAGFMLQRKKKAS